MTFVVITLVAGGARRASSTGIGAFTSPTVVHFGVALYVSAVLSAPWRLLLHAGGLVALAGLFGVVYSVLVVRRLRTMREDYDPGCDDWMRYVVFPLAGYVGLLAAGILLPAAPVNAMFGIAGATLFLIFVGIHNAWDVVTYIAVDRAEDDND